MTRPLSGTPADERDETTAPEVAAAIIFHEQLDPLVCDLRDAINTRRADLARSLATEIATAADGLARILAARITSEAER